jgi:outer membrane lipoprotein LolB
MTTQEVPVGGPFERDRVESFQLSGRVAVRREDQGWHAALEWSHARDTDELELVSPLGQVLAQLSRDGDGARLVSGDGETRAGDLDTLGAQVFGEDVPLSSVARWVLARPASADTAMERDKRGRPAAWVETGWSVRVARYEDERDQAMPRLIVAERGAIAIRLHIDRWDAVREAR